MAAEEAESLESLLNKATSPLNRQEDWEMVMAFCDQVNNEHEGPQISVRLLAHKIQSPQEREALYGLTVLEACVKNCGRRFHSEVGKFRFLNEVIKVVSPKYLGNHTSEKVKKRCIELMYSWSVGLDHEMKVSEAYDMLKRQGIVTEDPDYVPHDFEVPPERPKNAVFEDEEKSKLLARLLKSKHPEDLQAANRLIKNMVKQDSERIEKVSRRMQELEVVENNIKVLTEMLAYYSPGSANQSEKDIMKELHDNLEKSRPNLFRLASDTDEKDCDGITDILKANDNMVKVMVRYKEVVEGEAEENGLLMDNEAKSSPCSLLDLNTPVSDSLNSLLSSSPASHILGLLEEQNLLGSGGPIAGGENSKQSDLEMLGDIFSSGGGDAAPVQQDQSLLTGLMGAPPAATQSLDMMMDGATTGILSGLPMSQPSIPQARQPLNTFSSTPSPFSSVQQPTMGASGMAAQAPVNHQAPAFGSLTGQSNFGSQNMATGSNVLQGFSQPIPPMTQTQPQPSLSQPMRPSFPLSSGTTATGATTVRSNSTGPAQPTRGTLDELDVLGQSLMQQSLADKKSNVPSSSATGTPTKSATAAPPAQPAPLLVHTAHPPVHPTPPPVHPVAPLVSIAASTPPAIGTISPMSTPPVSLTSSPHRTPFRSTVEIQPLTDISVPLESIQPGTQSPLTAFDKNGIKIIFHFGKDRPRPDVSVIVVSVMSTNSSPVKGFSYQAAVPKTMKVKLQPASATDLPAYNPILPPAAITQVLLIANPHKEKIRLKFKVRYTMDEQINTEVGEVEHFIVQ